MKIGDVVSLEGEPGYVSWLTSEFIDVTMDNLSPYKYEKIAKEARIASKLYGTHKNVFTFDRKSAYLSGLVNTGPADVDNKCCCGCESVGSSRHVYYCPKYSNL